MKTEETSMNKHNTSPRIRHFKQNLRVIVKIRLMLNDIISVNGVNQISTAFTMQPQKSKRFYIVKRLEYDNIPTNAYLVRTYSTPNSATLICYRMSKKP